VVDALVAYWNTSIKLGNSNLVALVTSRTKEIAVLMEQIFLANRESHLVKPNASECLGSASKRMYSFIRNKLKVPINRDLVDHPKSESSNGRENDKQRPGFNTGSHISRIYQALKDERILAPLMEYLKEAVEANKKQSIGSAKL
jgi:phenylalanine ammonia-lyase